MPRQAGETSLATTTPGLRTKSATMSLTVTLALVGVLIVIALTLRTRTWLRLRHIPGPPIAGITEFWLLKKTLSGRCHIDLLEACKKYGIIEEYGVVNEETQPLIVKLGPLVRIGPNHLITDDPGVLRKMSAVRSPYRRSIWYDGLRLEHDYFNVVSERDENRHNDLRAKMGAGVS
jgi:hypothetical protein